MKMHFRDIRMSNNAGINFPNCCTNSELLDMDKARLPTTGNFKEVTCKRCLKQAPKDYPWASFAQGEK